MSDAAAAVAAPDSRALELRLLRATKPFAGEDPGRSWRAVLSTLAILAALIAFTLLDVPAYGKAAAGFLAGLVAVRMFILYHDYQHGAILRRSRPARWLMRFYGLLTLNPPSIWNRSHNHHHANNSKIYGADIGSFPLMTREAWAAAGPAERFRYAAARHPLVFLLGYLTVFLFGMTIRPLLINPRRHFDCALALLVHAGLIALLAWIDPWALLYTLWLPLGVAAVLGAYLFYAQHNFPDMKLKCRSEWTYAGAAVYASSYLDLSPLLHWITGNIGYHPVHHLNARIPFYRLPEAFAAIPELRASGRTDLSVKGILACLRLKLWDADADRMTTFSGRP